MLLKYVLLQNIDFLHKYMMHQTPVYLRKQKSMVLAISWTENFWSLSQSSNLMCVEVSAYKTAQITIKNKYCVYFLI